MDLPVGFAGGERAQPERGLVADAVADHRAEVEDATASQRRQRRVVEGGAEID
ncbi:MAG: hypothetical protein AVDCRST_MAG76-3745 [uncultured Acidimicrobiales bacterium]|uniref:Uncharacterized protein n=1 Tax=uncultured Acidimicrobiales bacterium TaxID=310071 RepID=A0A6J4JF00_9ACTN|nr:MAG: hypothetical protein AVDCRST_MAG76-3745 [uncultured Acidimicrobiales bacterium]